MSKRIVLVVARADNGVIGRDNALPWRIQADLKRFKTLTLGKPMVMGRKTFASLPGLLPGRRHIVLTRDPDWSAPGAQVARNVQEALEMAGGGEIAIIGGAEIYALFAPLAGRIELTEVHAEIEGDTLLPDLGDDWSETLRENHPALGETPAYSFVTLERRHP
jgi:dihydrofolate reductase